MKGRDWWIADIRKPPKLSLRNHIESLGMSYSIHIERLGATGARDRIAEHEWVAAVEGDRKLRIRKEGYSARNPKTREVISIEATGLDAEWYCDAAQEWQPTFFWSPVGSVSFDATDNFNDPKGSFRIFVSTLARSLRAELRGDEGECYSFPADR